MPSYVVTTVLGLVFAFPLRWMLSTALKQLDQVFSSTVSRRLVADRPVLADCAAADQATTRSADGAVVPAQREPVPRTAGVPQLPEIFTLPIALNQYDDEYGKPLWNVQMAATALTILPVFGVFIPAQRTFIRGLATTGPKG